MCYINHLGLHKLGLGMGDNPLRSCPSSLLVLWVQSRKAKKKKKVINPTGMNTAYNRETQSNSKRLTGTNPV